MPRRKKFKTHRRRLRTVAVLPVLVTLLNGVCGFASIHFAAKSMMEPNLLKHPQLSYLAAAAWLIFLAMVADGLDGFLARKSGNITDFGEQLDSLADVVSFGVAPAFLMLRVIESSSLLEIHQVSPVFGSLLGRLLWLVAALYICCALLRLARFNVETAPDINSHLFFSGLPTPAAAAVIASIVLLYSDLLKEFQLDLPTLTRILSAVIIYLLPFICAAIALLMVSRIRYSHLVNQYIRGRKPFRYMVYLVFVLMLLIWKLQLTLALGSLAFAISGVVRWLWHQRRSAHTHTADTTKKLPEKPSEPPKKTDKDLSFPPTRESREN